LHAAPPLRFQPCTLVEVSAAGARCRLPDGGSDPLPGTIVQIKVPLPNSRGHIQGIARVVRVVGRGLISVEFLQMTQRDQNLLSTFCLRVLLSRGGGDLSARRRREEKAPS
jgi:c-di-GMP-binding flagellar brake protein YcgR